MTEYELLNHYRPWLRKVASGMTDSNHVEDLASEGWIALWRASKTYDGRSPLDWWLKRKATGRMLMLVQRDWRTPTERQHVAVGLPQAPAADPVWDRLSVDLPEIEAAYHFGEIMLALNELSPREREYVVLRFWGDARYGELTRYFGYEPTGLWRRSRVKLSRSLAHLAPLVQAGA